MKKTPSLYRRNPDNMRRVLPELTPSCEWVIAGEGTATFKWDGTCVMRDTEGDWWARREVKPGKNPPPNWVELDADPVTNKRMGWEPIAQSGYRGAFEDASDFPDHPGTYELIGPKINGNPHGIVGLHLLMPHGTTPLSDVPTEFAALSVWLKEMAAASRYFEGVVWHHPDGRMAKIKVRDFARES